MLNRLLFKNSIYCLKIILAVINLKEILIL